MSDQTEIQIQEISPEQNHPYWHCLSIPAGEAPKQGETWQCWNGLYRLGQGNFSLGMVKTAPLREMKVRIMERHPNIEMVIPISGPIIQVLSISRKGPTGEEEPDARTAEAFLVRVGQILVIQPGVWHYAAFPFQEEEVTYFYLTEPYHNPSKTSPWVPFGAGKTVRVTRRQEAWM
jgi:ureidoglycolate hydrolase